MSGSDRRLDPDALGLILGGGVLALIVVLIFVFKNHGLPKDPAVWKRMEQQRSAEGTP